VIVTRRNQPLLLTARPFASAPNTPGPSGTGGVAFYRSVDLEGGDPPPIAYRKLRFTRGGGIALQRHSRNKTEAEAAYTEPTTELTAEVIGGASYRVQLRAWRDDVENPQTYGEQVLLVDNDGNTTPLIEGGGYVLSVQKRQAGGMRVIVVWVSPPNVAPVTLALTRVSGPTAVSDVVLNWSETARQYVFTVTGLQDAGSYVFRVVAERSGYTIRAKAAFGSGSTDFTFVADGSGPSAVSSLTIRAT
jgi:hypothetical protein